MNRPIKFRAWDKKAKYMELPGICNAFIDAEGNIFEDSAKKHDTPNQEITRTDRYELMQFTGLLDKNGKEIYEGDCFEINKKSTGTRIGIAYVIWDEREVRFRVTDTLKSGEYSIRYFSMYCEIIGNIYENPELV